jgi:hypothetical protein
MSRRATSRGSAASAAAAPAAASSSVASAKKKKPLIVDPFLLSWDAKSAGCKSKAETYDGKNMVEWLRYLASDEAGAAGNKHSLTDMFSLFEGMEMDGDAQGPELQHVVLKWLDNKKNLVIPADLIVYCRAVLKRSATQKKRFLVLPIEIGKVVGTRENLTHASVLLIDFEQRAILRIDPNGVNTGGMPYDNTLLDTQLQTVFLPLFPEIALFRYVPLAQVYAYDPMLPGGLDTGKKRELVRQNPDTYVFDGPQRKEAMSGGSYKKKTETDGYCLAWALMLAHYMTMNPEHSFSEIVDYLMKHSGVELRNFVRQYNCMILEKTDGPEMEENSNGDDNNEE